MTVKKRTKLRPLGSITDDLEPLMFELTEEHGLQLHEIFGILTSWAESHFPECIENYNDGTRPILYGHKKTIRSQDNE